MGSEMCIRDRSRIVSYRGSVHLVQVENNRGKKTISIKDIRDLMDTMPTSTENLTIPIQVHPTLPEHPEEDGEILRRNSGLPEGDSHTTSSLRSSVSPKDEFSESLKGSLKKLKPVEASVENKGCNNDISTALEIALGVIKVANAHCSESSSDTDESCSSGWEDDQKE